jgi:hypothetical protein
MRLLYLRQRIELGWCLGSGRQINPVNRGLAVLEMDQVRQTEFIVGVCS